MTSERPSAIGALLAGGQSRRMGGDKPLCVLQGRPLIAHTAARLGPQCDGLIVSANGDPARYAMLDCPVLADSVAGFAGPLAGVLAALEWAASNRPETRWIVSAPADCPFLPADLVARLLASRASGNADMAFAASGGHIHHACGLWPMTAREPLAHALMEDGVRKAADFTARFKRAIAEWPALPRDPFFNINTPADLALAEGMSA